MEDLRRLIELAVREHRNTKDQDFASDQEICRLITRDAVRKALSEALNDDSTSKGRRLERFHINGATDIIVNRARRIFAILVYISRMKFIDKFIEADNYQSLDLDSRLPFTKNSLEAIFSDQNVAMEFYAQQWHFMAPVFSDSIFTRVLPPETILPITEEKVLGEGGFGLVKAIRIPRSHQRYNQELVQKEFCSPSPAKNQSAFETELRNLSILKLLRHPYIIELLSCYAYQSTFYLVFPRAQGGTLKDFLSRGRPEEFSSDQTILVALSGLCSAVRAVHQFVCAKNQLELIGLHHDIKPANVLIEGSKFVLADFGLSRFKEASESSATPSVQVFPCYMAPECWRAAKNSERPIINQSSDIWSLGCMVAEVVAYILSGVKGVEDFERQRGTREGQATRCRFHDAGAELKAVATWIAKRKGSSRRTERMLGQLVEGALQICPQNRLKAQEVEANMHFIAIDSFCEVIVQQYDKLCDMAASFQPMLERIRFDSWRHGFGVLEFIEEHPLDQWNENADYPFIYQSLGQILDELKAISAEYSNIKSRIFEPLRQLNLQLISRLSVKDKCSAGLYFKTEILSKQSNAASLAEGSEIDESLAQANKLRILVLTAAESVNSVLRDCAHPRYIARERLTEEKRIDDLIIGQCKDVDSNHARRVVWESKTYKEHYADKRIATELQQRLENIVGILLQANEATGDNGFRVLRCVGFYHDLSEYSCGLVYEFPASSEPLGFLTLKKALGKGNNKPPPLEERFQLARALSSSVLHFHSVSWLQKSISSYNIAFFYRKDEQLLSDFANPFFMGFLHSRSNDIDGFTEGPDEKSRHQDYQYPDYVHKKAGEARYRTEYDYYSLGLVLLEIGLWKPLSTIDEFAKASREHNLSTARFHQLLDSLSKPLSRVKVTMGTRYAKVVQTCLEGSFGISREGENKQLLREFSNKVVEVLENCIV